MHAQLLHSLGGSSLSLLLKPGVEFKLGRGSGNDLKILGHGLSREHARVVGSSCGGFALVDLGSQNGTFLNERRLPPHQESALSPGDRVRLGSCELCFEQVADDSEDEAPSDAGSAEEPESDMAGSGDSVELLLQTIADLNQRQDPEQLLPAIVDRVLRLTGAQRGLLLLRGRDGLETCLARTREGEDIERVEGTSQSIPAQVLKTGVAVCITGSPGQGSDGISTSMNDYDLRAVLCVPIREYGTVRGVLYVDSQQETREFNERDRRYLEALAAQCGFALERAALRRQELDERRRLEEENASLKGGGVSRPVGDSAAMQEVLGQLERVAKSDLSLLITGETGCGKEVMAHYAHALSHRRDKPFVVVDCGAIPETLLESVLFGHVKGAFTGATSNQQGLFQRAHGGTLLFDELGELPLLLQPKLLRFLEEQSFQPVGGSQRVTVDVRVIACTNRKLEEMVKERTFREDLYFRLNTFPICLPPLRTRKDDVIPLARHLLATVREDAHAQGLSGFTAEAEAAMRAYDWPGNVREVLHRLRRAAVVATPPFITVVDLGLPLPEGAPPTGLLPLQEARKAARQLATDRFELEYVTTLLRLQRGQVQRAAEAAGVSRQMLQRLMARHGISRRSFLPQQEDGGN